MKTCTAGEKCVCHSPVHGGNMINYTTLRSIAWIYDGVGMKKSIKELPEHIGTFLEDDKTYRLTIERIEEEK